MSDIFAALADPTRRAILVALRDARAVGADAAHELSVGDLVAALGVSQPTVSKHLKVLRDHGLVAVRDAAQRRYYRVDPGPLDQLESWLLPFLEPAVDVVAPVDPAVAADAGALVYRAWAGGSVGGRVGRAAAETAFGAVRRADGIRRRVSGRRGRR